MIRDLYRDVKERDHGDVYTSDYILDETLTLALARSCRIEIIRDLEAFIRRSSWIKFIMTSEAEIDVT
ncbi:MAG TPA: hypothetical protein VKM55_08565 [Candidatus Lokiarchaeia archaeon]|nr:hypothetical protein [Candidatus Lokiarchaeia archaeon]